MKSFESPVYNIRSVPVEKIEPNSYNPNAVAPPELKLLYDSIKEDGYTMPIVCYYDEQRDRYTIVDGFHRYRIMLDYPDIYRREGGKLPVSVIDKPLDCRMASTIRHNRARGSHDVDLMSNIISELHDLGRSDAWISKHLGMDKDEILRLKQITGLTALFREVDFSKAWIPAEEEAGEFPKNLSAVGETAATAEPLKQKNSRKEKKANQESEEIDLELTETIPNTAD